MEWLHGIALGMGTAVILGPVFFTLMKNALHGRLAGVATATGIIASDVLVLFLCLSFARQVVQQFFESEYVYLLSAAVLIILGFSFLVKRIDLHELSTVKANRVHTKAFFQGFAINLFNPFVFAIWLSFISIGQSNYSHAERFWPFALGILIGVYSTDLLKAYFVHRLKALLQNKHVRGIYKVIGLVLMAFALRLVVMALN